MIKVQFIFYCIFCYISILFPEVSIEQIRAHRTRVWSFRWVNFHFFRCLWLWLFEATLAANQLQGDLYSVSEILFICFIRDHRTGNFKRMYSMPIPSLIERQWVIFNDFRIPELSQDKVYKDLDVLWGPGSSMSVYRIKNWNRLILFLIVSNKS